MVWVLESGINAYVNRFAGIDLVSKFGEHIVDFEATHPFILYIEDETTNTVVFVAKVSNPEGSGKPIVSALAPIPINTPAGKPTG